MKTDPDDFWYLNSGNSHISDFDLNYYDSRTFDDTPFHHLSRLRHDLYHKNVILTIRGLYVLATIIWIIIVYWGRFYKTDMLGKFILIIPIVMFLISFSNVESHTKKVSANMLKGNILSFMFLTVSLLINWLKIGDRKKIYRAMIISIIFVTISLLDFWVNDKDYIYIIHIKTMAQTIALTLLTYALYIRYNDNVIEIISNKESIKKVINIMDTA